MKFLLDTQLLLWIAGDPQRLSQDMHLELNDPANEFVFSAASLWEISIKSALGREDFRVNPRLLREGLLDHGYTELSITGEHAVSIDALPPLHKIRSTESCSSRRSAKVLRFLPLRNDSPRYAGAVRKV